MKCNNNMVSLLTRLIILHEKTQGLSSSILIGFKPCKLKRAGFMFFSMARPRILLLLLLCLVLSDSFLFTQNAYGLRILGPFAPVPSPLPSEGGVDIGTGDQAPVVITYIIKKHHSFDKSMAGGDLILGGFATALVASIFCCIRVTRRNQHNHDLR